MREVSKFRRLICNLWWFLVFLVFVFKWGLVIVLFLGGGGSDYLGFFGLVYGIVCFFFFIFRD